MSEFTKGQWQAQGLRVRVENRGCIVIIPGPADGGVFECSANTRLIAAAPEHARSSEVIVAGYDYNPAGLHDLDDEQPIHVSMTLGDYRRARAAIAKATGATRPIGG